MEGGFAGGEGGGVAAGGVGDDDEDALGRSGDSGSSGGLERTGSMIVLASDFSREDSTLALLEGERGRVLRLVREVAVDFPERKRFRQALREERPACPAL